MKLWSSSARRFIRWFLQRFTVNIFCLFSRKYFFQGNSWASMHSQQHLWRVQFLQGGEEPGGGPHGSVRPPAERLGDGRRHCLRLPTGDRDQHEGGADVWPEGLPARGGVPRDVGVGQDPGQAPVLRHQDRPGGGAVAGVAVQHQPQPRAGRGEAARLLLQAGQGLWAGHQPPQYLDGRLLCQGIVSFQGC